MVINLKKQSNTMRTLLLSVFLVFPFASIAQKAVPELWGVHVHDDADVLTKGVVDELEHALARYEDSTSNQIAILIVSSLEGESLEEYSLRVAEKWKLGQEKKDNGALLLIAVGDRKMRIEAGYGLEGVLTDAVCSQIIRNELAPRFRESDYDGGVQAAISAMVDAIAGEYTADETTEPNQIADMTWKERLGIGVFVFGILGIFTFLALFIKGGSGWFLYVFLIPFYAAFPMVIFGLDGGLIVLGTFVLGFPIARLLLGKTSFGKRLGKKMGKGGSGGGGWSSGSGWSSGGSSGGGFSGGGGGFGGGGASGSW